ncbi:MAG: alpha-2-macroglobulin family protein [Saprospiraceae bacterium]
MKRLYLALSLMVSLLPLCAQELKPIGLVFQLTAKEAAYLYEKEPLSVPAAYFHTLVDSFLSGEPSRPLLPNGHYMEVEAKREVLSIQLRSIHAHTVLTFNNERDLSLRVINESGESQVDALVQLGAKKISFDGKTQSFRLKKRNRGGFLQVSIAGDTLFYDVNPQNNKPLIARRYRRFANTDVAFILTTPIRLVFNVYRYFERGIRRNYWRPRFPRFRRKDKSLNGYVVTHKPKYQPNDTLRMKAFVTLPKGRPINKALRLKIRDRQRFKTIVVDTLLMPISPGAFVFDLPLADSLKLDQRYSIFLDHPKRDRLDGLSHNFLYEDYQLDEVTYTIVASQDTFRQGQPFNLTATAKDQNDLPVFDAQLQLQLLSKDLLQFYSDEVQIPDTLWTYETALDQRGQAEVVLPDSLFPAAKMTIKAIANFTNSNGELQQKEIDFTYTPLPDLVQLEAVAGKIKASVQKNGNDFPTQGLLLSKAYYLSKEDTMNVALPYQGKLDPNIHQYQLLTSEGRAKLQLGDRDGQQKVQLDVNAWLQNDTIHLSLNNPHQLPVNWIIRHRSGMLAEGFTRDSVFHQQKAGTGAKGYFLHYQYQWGGKEYTGEKEIQLYKQLLQVSIEQAPQVMPGEAVQVKVTVKDYKNRPAKDVNLAVGAINAQFESNDHFEGPAMVYKKAKEPFFYNEFEVDPKAYTAKTAIKSNWYEDLALDRSLYYRLRFPTEGVYFQSDTLTSDTFYQKIAQFAPYLVKNGKAEPIYLIYCNRRLVYYYDISQPQPYSFRGAAGYNLITIRTLDQEITIDSVWLREGHKLEFSIDLLHYPKWEKHQRITRKVMPNYFTPEEKRLIANEIFVLKKYPVNRPFLVWDNAHHIQLFNASYTRDNIKLGPFLNGSQLHYKESSGLKTDFVFESGFAYELAPGRERLFAHALFEKKDSPLPRFPPKPTLNDVVYPPSMIDANAKNYTIQYKEVAQYDRETQAIGRYIFSYEKHRDTALVAIAFQQSDKTIAVYRPQTTAKYILPAGTYTLYLFRSDQSYHQRIVQINPNSTLYQNLNQALFSLDEANKTLQEKVELTVRDMLSPILRNPAPAPYRYGGMQQVIGRVTDESGEPLIGASILVKGTTMGMVTDIDGNYELVLPAGHNELIISYTGFEQQEIGVFGNERVNVVLPESAMHLDEVIVTGYGSGARKNLKSLEYDAFEYQDLNPFVALQGRSAGVIAEGSSDLINIRGNTSIEGQEPLYIIDGKIANPSQLDPQRVKSLKVLKGLEATALYGSRAANGVILITTNSDPSFDFFDPAMAKGLRTEFRDYAYWEPNVITDKKGEVSFKVTFPDNITAWKAYALGMDKHKRSGIGFSHTQAYKPLIAQLAVPRFLIEGDQVEVIGKASNYTSDSLAIETRFLSSDTLLRQQEGWLLNGKVESAKIQAGMAGDSLAITYALESKNKPFEDGEKRHIPIFSKGTMEHVGQFLVLDKDTSLSLSFRPELGKVEIFVEQDLLPVLLKEIDYLKNYHYGCNEQTASKLMALVLEKQIKAYLGETFDQDAMLEKCIKTLEKNQYETGEWGWWDKSQGVSWITRHVTKSLLMAKAIGISSPALELALRRLTSTIKTKTTNDLLPSLALLAEAGQVFPFEAYLPQMDSMSLSVQERLWCLRIRQLAKLPYTLDSLYHYQQTTLFGSHFWGSPSMNLTQNDISTTLLAYKILLDAGEYQAAALAQRYLLEQRQNSTGRHAWRNTLETAQVLRDLLPQLLKGKKDSIINPTLTLKGAINATIDTFPYQWSTDQSQRPLDIQKTGTSTLYLAAYQSFLNPNPTKQEKGFKVSSLIKQEGQIVQTIEKDKQTTLVVTVENDKSATYVMLEVPIPGSCSYYAKPNGQKGVEVHREYAKQQTSIFIEALPAGKHEFSIELEPRFSGQFTLNPAKVELMYFPVLYGREGMKVVEVSGQ